MCPYCAQVSSKSFLLLYAQKCSCNKTNGLEIPAKEVTMEESLQCYMMQSTFVKNKNFKRSVEVCCEKKILRFFLYFQMLSKPSAPEDS